MIGRVSGQRSRIAVVTPLSEPNLSCTGYSPPPPCTYGAPGAFEGPNVASCAKSGRYLRLRIVRAAGCRSLHYDPSSCLPLLTIGDNPQAVDCEETRWP